MKPNFTLMETSIKGLVRVNKTLLVGLLAGVGVALSYTYWWSQPLRKDNIPVSHRSDYPTEWLGI